MKISLSSCGFSGLYSSPKELVEACAKTKFRYIDFSFTGVVESENFFKDINECADTAKKMGIGFTMAHAPYNFNPNAGEENFDKQVEQMKKAFEGCGILGIDRMTVHSGFSCSKTRDEMMQKNLKYYNAILPYAEKYNVKIMVENIAEEIYRRVFVIETADNILELKEMLNNHPLIKACWDTGHANTKALDQYSNIKKLKGELVGLHLQDNNGYNDDHMPLLMGTINFDDVMKGLIEIGYDGPFNMETKLFNPGKAWPNFRRGFSPESKAESVLFDPDEELKYYSVDIMYNVAEYILKKYNIKCD